MATSVEKGVPNNHKLCELCGQAWRERQRPHCWICGLANLAYRRIGTGQADAIKAVRREVKYGRLAAPTDFPCVDCGNPAVAYEHRDYNHPLDVVPVCRPCNAKRGYATPKKMTFAAFWTACQNSRYAQLTREQVEPIRLKYFKETV